MMLFALTFEGNVREWYPSLPPTNIGDFDPFEDVFKKIWASYADGDFDLENFYYIGKKGNESIRKFIQMFDRIVKDTLDFLKPTDAQILDKFIKGVEGHLTYQLRDRKPKTLA